MSKTSERVVEDYEELRQPLLFHYHLYGLLGFLCTSSPSLFISTLLTTNLVTIFMYLSEHRTRDKKLNKTVRELL